MKNDQTSKTDIPNSDDIDEIFRDDRPRSVRPIIFMLIGGCLFLMVCCGLPTALWESMKNYAPTGNFKAEAAERDKKLSSIAMRSTVTDEEALELLANEIFATMSLASDSIESFNMERGMDDKIAVSIVLRKDFSRNNVKWTDYSSDDPEARKSVVMNMLLVESGLFAKHGQARNLGTLSVLLRTRAYVDDTHADWFDLFGFHVQPEDFQQFVEKTTPVVMIPFPPLTKADLEDVCTVEVDNFHEFTLEIRYR